MSNFQKRAPLSKRPRGGTSAPNDLPWYVPEALQLSDINLHKLKKKQQKNKKNKNETASLSLVLPKLEEDDTNTGVENEQFIKLEKAGI